MSETIIAILLYLLTVCKAANYQCLNCDDLNRLNLIQCHLNYASCGECKSGFSVDDKDPRFCFEIETVEGVPGTVGGVEGQSIELPCVFNTDVDCFWEKNGNKIKVDDSIRFRFKTKIKEHLAKDCTLVIDRLSPSDVDDWRCATAHVKSENIKVEIAKQKLTISQITIRNTETTESRETRSTKAPDKEISNDLKLHVLHVYLNDQNVDGRVISMAGLRNNLNRSLLECRTEVEVDELRWEINGKSIIKISNANSIQIQTEDLENYFIYQPFLKVYCIAVNTGYTDSYVFVIDNGDLKSMVRKDEKPNILLKVLIAVEIVLSILLVGLMSLLIWFLRKRSKWNGQKWRIGDASDDGELKPMEIQNEEKQSTKSSFFKNTDTF